MAYKAVDYSSGHALRDNGVGDYDLHCPVVGRVGFMHMGQVMILSRCRCFACDQPIGEQVSTGKPYEIGA